MHKLRKQQPFWVRKRLLGYRRFTGLYSWMLCFDDSQQTVLGRSSQDAPDARYPRPLRNHPRHPSLVFHALCSFSFSDYYHRHWVKLFRSTRTFSCFLFYTLRYIQLTWPAIGILTLTAHLLTDLAHLTSPPSDGPPARLRLGRSTTLRKWNRRKTTPHVVVAEFKTGITIRHAFHHTTTGTSTTDHHTTANPTAPLDVYRSQTRSQKSFMARLDRSLHVRMAFGPGDREMGEQAEMDRLDPR